MLGKDIKRIYQDIRQILPADLELEPETDYKLYFDELDKLTISKVDNAEIIYKEK